MQKREREWVAMLLAELQFIGMGELSDHYHFVLVNMDNKLGKEYDACMTTFRNVERSGRPDASKRDLGDSSRTLTGL